MDAYHASESVQEAADRAGITVSAFRGWKMRNGLDRLPYENPRWLDSREHQLRRVLYWLGLNDVEIGSLIGLESSTIRDWRHASFLPSVIIRREYTGSKQDICNAYFEEPTDEDIARKADVSLFQVERWRRTNRIPPRRGLLDVQVAMVKSDRHEKRWNAYCLSTSSELAAEISGTTTSSMRKWIRRMNLPAPHRGRMHRRVVVQAAEQGDYIAQQACKQRMWNWRTTKEERR